MGAILLFSCLTASFSIARHAFPSFFSPLSPDPPWSTLSSFTFNASRYARACSTRESTFADHPPILPSQDCVQKLKDKLVEAAGVYRNDKETLDWHVMQDPKVSSGAGPAAHGPLMDLGSHRTKRNLQSWSVTSRSRRSNTT